MEDGPTVITTTFFDVVGVAEDLAVEWLRGYTNVETRNGYAIDIGIRGEKRSRLPGGPARPKPLPPQAWIPWAVEHGIDPCGELTVRNVQDYAHALDPLPKNTRRRRWFSLCGYYAFLRREKRVTSDPDLLIGGRNGRKNMGLSGTEPTSTKPVTEKQMRAMYLASQLDTTQHRNRNRAMLSVQSVTGARTEEVVNLDLEDFQRVEPGGPALVLLDGKGAQERWQLIPARDADLVEDYIRTERVAAATGTELTVAGQVSNRPRVRQPLFTTHQGERLHVDSIAPLYRRIAKIPQLDDPRPEVRAAARELLPIKDRLRPHQMRHSYAVTGEKNGKPVSQIAADLGHKNLATTHTYLHVSKQGENSAAAVVSDIYHAGEVELDELYSTSDHEPCHETQEPVGAAPD